MKPSRVTAFEDDSDEEDVSEGPQRKPHFLPPTRPIPAIKKPEPIIQKIVIPTEPVKEEMKDGKPSQGQDNETRPQSQLNSARQKNLEEI